ncbi:hypothetical protein GWI33_007432 [Rhynchophorus ferrugineus]|uniref:Protein takeout n=1 Tax=Rhynchophorus ferrugineus TaxID=354439 RepID=A0A834MIA6_RHYFE|nr:hypothetical protein GWI33_007432 [Rhynchophorus ferrugineus]
MVVVILFLAVLGLFNICDSITFKYCKGSESSSDACLIDAISDALQQLKAGYKEFGLKGLDVYKIPAISVEAGKGAVHFTQNYRNIQLLGFTDAVVKEAHFDRQNNAFTFTMFIPLLTQKADYNVNGKLLTLPITGNGSSVFELYNMNLKIDMTLDDYTRDGEHYYKIKSIQVYLPISKLKGHFDNLFNGNKLLGDNVNRLLNDEWEAIYSDVQHPLELAYGKDFEMYIQTFLDHVPAKDLF